MVKELKYQVINGIKCYSLDVSQKYDNFPEECVTDYQEVENNFFWTKSRSRILQQLVQKYIRFLPSKKFLEIGCHTGLFINKLAIDKSLKITGSEIYFKGISYIKKMPNIEIIQYDVTQGVLPEKYDMVGSFDVLEHIDNDTDAMCNIYHMLNNNGYFILTVPQYMFLWSKHDEINKHKRRYSKQELLEKLRLQGFDIVFCSSFFFTLFPLMLISRLVDRCSRKEKTFNSNLKNIINFPLWVNWLFDKIMRIDETLISAGISLPFGGSLLVIAQKKGSVVHER